MEGGSEASGEGSLAEVISGGPTSGVGDRAGSSIKFRVRSMRPSSSPPSNHLDSQKSNARTNG